MLAVSVAVAYLRGYFALSFTHLGFLFWHWLFFQIFILFLSKAPLQAW